MFFTVAITHKSTKNRLGLRLSESLFRIILTDDSTSWFPKQACSLHCFLLTVFLQDAPFICSFAQPGMNERELKGKKSSELLNQFSSLIFSTN